ncbi:hypothetical protein AI2983V1_2770 [Enterobacter cloacae]|nr:hypothetical protein AI2983V1_2770 [Enterobacter cloacae]CAH5654182.1 hypothetical protein AI2983V1_2770 [Enterobacter cloacae]
MTRNQSVLKVATSGMITPQNARAREHREGKNRPPLW